MHISLWNIFKYCCSGLKWKNFSRASLQWSDDIFTCIWLLLLYLLYAPKASKIVEHCGRHVWRLLNTHDMLLLRACPRMAWNWMPRAGWFTHEKNEPTTFSTNGILKVLIRERLMWISPLADPLASLHSPRTLELHVFEQSFFGWSSVPKQI